MTTAVYQREDWTLFGNRQTLGQKAGVPQSRIPRLVVKELVDNALDACGGCRYGTVEGAGRVVVYVEDDGPGLPCDTDEAVAELFSIRRPLVTSKIIRRPSRGALGNGLRVVAGAAAASGGTITVRTRGRSLVLRPGRDGETKIVTSAPWEGTGTRIELDLNGWFDEVKDNVFAWASVAKRLAGRDGYKGASSPWWYDTDSFHDLLRAAGGRTVREVVEQLDGCSGPKASAIAGGFKGRRAAELDEAEGDRLLLAARGQAKQVKASRLKLVGRMDDEYAGYAKEEGEFRVRPVHGTAEAVLPFVVEVWARKSSKPSIRVCVNRTPVTAPFQVERQSDDRSDYAVFGGNLSHRFRVGRSDYEFLVNVQTPYMPITSDGKAPDLLPVHRELLGALQSAAARAMKNQPRGPSRQSQKDFLYRVIPEGIRRASGDGRHRYSLRQLFYAIRPLFLEAFNNQEPNYGTFAKVVTRYEADEGEDLPGVYRDARGTLYHPHTREEIALGTLAVERYERPEWTFNKVLYCEKEGFFPLLKDARWPERHDCALLTSKGFATRAVRDLLDLLGDGEEEVTIFCLHDADGYGTTIYEALQLGTVARPGRAVKVVNLGLEPAEGLDMGLQAEAVKPKVNKKTGAPKKVPVGGYVPEYWRRWLQKNRVELNAMTTPQFLDWLDAKMAPYAGKVVPPEEVMAERLEEELTEQVRAAVQQRILRDAGAEQKVAETLAELRPWLEGRSASLDPDVRAALLAEPSSHWAKPLERMAAEVVAERVSGKAG
jgi:hypothetical protein